MLANIFIALVAAIHVYILVLEMFLWDTKTGRKAFNLSADFARELRSGYGAFLSCIVAITLNAGAYVSEIFRNAGMQTEIFTPFACGTMTQLFSKDQANKCFAEGKVVFFAGGTGHPYFSTDTATVLRAVEIEADAILLAKAVDGIYDSDPKVNPDAVKYDEISIQEVVDKKLAAMDLTASIMCLEQKMPMMVFALDEENSIINTVHGKFSGTKVTV